MKERKKPRWRVEPVKCFFRMLEEHEMLISCTVAAVITVLINLLTK